MQQKNPHNLAIDFAQIQIIHEDFAIKYFYEPTIKLKQHDQSNRP